MSATLKLRIAFALLVLPQLLPAQTVVYQESFETTVHNWQISGYSGIWLRDASGTPSSQTGPSAAVDGSYYFFTESSGNRRNKIATLESPVISVPTGNPSALKFHYHMYGSSMGTLRVIVLKNGQLNGTVVWSESGNQGNQWYPFTADLSDFAGENIRIRIVGETGPSYRSDMAVDNIVVEQSNQPASDPDCGTLVTNFPYTESFEVANGEWVQPPGGNNIWQRDQGSTPSSGTGPSGANDGSWFYYTEASYGNNPGKENYLVGPCFKFGNAANATLTFDYNMNGAGMGELEVQAQPAAGGPWQGLWYRQGNYGNEWRQASVNLGPLLNGNYRLRFRTRTGSSWQSDAAIDNLKITTNAAPPLNYWGTIVANFPYTESFESGFGDWTEEGGNLDVFRRTSYGTPNTSSTGPTAAFQGTYYVYTETSGANSGFKRSVLEGPAFDLVGQEHADFHFNYHARGSDINRLELQATTDAGLNWETVWTQVGEDANGPLSGNWHEAFVDLTDYVGGLVKLRFVTVTGNGYRGNLAIDNLRLVIPASNTTVAGIVRYLPAGMAYDHDNPLAGERVESVLVRVKPVGGGTEVYSVTDFQGRFSVAAGVGTVDVVPEVQETDYAEGLGADDVALINQHVLGTNYIEDPIARMAADVNRDGTIDVGDLIETQAIVIGNSTSFNNATNWQLLADHYLLRAEKTFHPDPVFRADFWNEDLQNASGQEYPYLAALSLPGRSLTYAGPDDWVGQLASWKINAGAAELCRPAANFILFKTGDVTRSASPHSFGDPSPNGTAGRSTSGALVGTMINQGGKENVVAQTDYTKSARPELHRLTKKKQKYEVSVFATSQEQIHSFQSELRYDPELIEVQRLQPNGSDLYRANDRAFTERIDRADPVIRTVWVASGKEGKRFKRDVASREEDLSQGKLLYRLDIDCYAGPEVAEASIRLANEGFPTVFHGLGGKAIEDVDVEIFITSNSNGKWSPEKTSTKAATDEGLAGISVYPNPAREVVRFELSGELSAATHARLLSAAGNVALDQALGVVGKRTHELPVPGQKPGVYYLEVYNGHGVLGSKRVVLVK